MKRTYYPLTSAQKLHLINLTEFPAPEALNIGVSLTLQTEIDFDLLKKCILLEYERCESLRIQFTKPDKDGNLYQYLVPYAKREIKLKDLSGMTEKEAENVMLGWTSIPLERADTLMNQFIMVILPGGYSGVYLKIDHTLIDSCGVIMMAKDIMELYCHYLFHTAYPAKPASYLKALEKDLAYEANCSRKTKAIDFWKSQLALGEPIYTDVTGSWKLEECRQRHHNPLLRAADREMEDIRAGSLVFHLGPDMADLLTDFCLTHSISMTNLLLMALRTYLSKKNNNEKNISINNYVSCRSGLNRTSGGSRVHVYPCRTILEPATTFFEGTLIIQSLQNQIYRHAGYDSLAVSAMFREHFHAPKNTTYEAAALTYQPFPIQLINKNFQGIPVKTNWFTNGTTIQKLYLTVMHSSADSGLDFYFLYQIAELTEQDIEAMYHDLIKILSIGVKNPDMTVGELLRCV